MLLSAIPAIERDILSDFQPDLNEYIRNLHRQKQELETQIQALRQDIINGNDTIKKQKSEVEFMARQSEQMKTQFRTLQENLKAVLMW